MEQATAQVHIKFTATCPYCGHNSQIEDNWDITEDHPLMQGMVDRFTKNTDYNYPTLINEDWINQAKSDGYENPYKCKGCGMDFEIIKVDW